MTFAIIGVKSRTVAKDAEGNPHIYNFKESAQPICDEMNKQAAEINGVDPVHGIPETFRVVPW